MEHCHGPLNQPEKALPRQHVMDAFASSTDEFDTLYQALAK